MEQGDVLLKGVAGILVVVLNEIYCLTAVQGALVILSSGSKDRLWWPPSR
jgi:hypothetical protein